MRLSLYHLALGFFLCAAVPSSAHSQVIKVGPLKKTSQPELEIIRRVPGNASFTDEKSWQNQKASTIKDITDYIPSIITQNRNGAESSRLSIRGSGLANTFQGRGLLILQDGIPLNMADGGFEFPVIDPWLTQHVEVYPGANALQYGASSFGGAINFITPTGETAPYSQIRTEAGSFKTLHGMIASGQKFKTSDVFAAVSGFDQEGFRDNNQQTTLRLNANTGWQINDNYLTRFYVSHTNSRAEIPGAISKAVISENPERANPANLARHYKRDLKITRLANRSEWESGARKLEVSAFYTARELDNPVTTYEFEDSDDFGVQTKYTENFGLNQIIAGANAYYGMADETRYQNIFARPGNFILARDLSALTSEAFVQYDQHLFANLYAIAGAQASYATRNIDQKAPLPSEQTKEYFGFNPKIGLRYDLDAETQLFTNLSRSFEPPTWSELSGGNSAGFNDLKAQKATTFEVGARGLYEGWIWNTAYYHGWLKNEFVNYRFEDGSSDTINADKTSRDGVEIGLIGSLWKDAFSDQDNFSLRAAYNWNHFTLDNDTLYGDNQLPGVPEHFLRAEILYNHPSGFSVGPNIEWTPQGYPVDLTNSLKTDPYATLGARAFWTGLDNSVNIFIEGRNLTDKNYIATSNVVPDAAGNDGNYFYPGEGRAFYAGMQIKF